MNINDIEKQVGSKTFCILPWIHLSTRPGGTVRTCCTSNASGVGPTNEREGAGMVGLVKNNEGKPHNLEHSTFLESWNSDYMKNVRLHMLNGNEPASCVKCYREEEAGHRSKRQWETEYWYQRTNLQELIDDTKEDGSTPPKLYYVDLRLGSKCNLKCVMCSPSDSSMWIPDWKKAITQVQNENLKQNMVWDKDGPDSYYNWYKNNPTFWDELYDQIPHMKQLYFAGGESTIIEEHYTLLERVIEMGYASEIELRYNSNAVELPDRLFELWNHFKKVRFHFSMDSIFEMNDYIRYPSDFNHLVEQMWKLDRTPDHVEITIACAVQMLNIYYIPDFIRWKLEQGFKKINVWPFGAGMINYHFVYWPAHLNVRVFPDEFKQKIKDKYESFYPWLEENWHLTNAPSKEVFMDANYGVKRLKGMISFMEGADWSQRMPEFQEYIQIMDRVRNTDFCKTFPEMSELL